MESNFKSTGICQKLRSFISMLACPEGPRGLVQVPIEDGSSRNGKSFIRPNDYLGSEIEVQFRHINRSERSDHRGDSVRAIKKDGLFVSHEKKVTQKGLEKKEETRVRFPIMIDQKAEKKERKFEAVGGMDTRGEGQKRIVSIKGSEIEGEIVKRKEDDKPNNQLNQDMKRRPARELGSFLNINKRSDSFIKRKKEDMRRNYSFDPDKS